MSEHKNKSRASIRPLNGATIALTTGGLGFLRPAPGTWGSVPPCAAMGLLLIGGASYWTIQLVMALVLVLACAVCVVLGRYAEARFGRKDAAEVVIDETAGVTLGLMLWPAGFVASCALPGEWTMEAAGGPFLRALVAVGAAFVLFRVSDIFKPWPARRLEDLPHGWGVLMDDVMAGVYAAAAMQVGLRFLPLG
ncbi:MAG: phosphatidylglycerophosphatase A [Phycisphaerales bacterium]|nr:phosphatidylglycerophosphatase A [Phycisphaerales bacterium]MCA9306701.1 phosphatidylglycerophosphatase A [Phycisphaerales bacterium]